MKRARIFVLLLSFGFTAYSQNLVINPGFESWSKINKPTGWTHTENCLKDSASILSGLYSCQHTGGATTSSDLGQTITVVPGKEYSLSFSFKTSASTSGNGVRIWCYWKDASGSSISDPSTDQILRPSNYMKSETWKSTSLMVAAPPAAVSFYLEVRTYPNSVSYWDDFVFKEESATGFTEYSSAFVTVYPNPVGDRLFIRNCRHLRQYDVVSSSGRVLLSAKLSDENILMIPVTELAAGVYLIRLYTNEGILTRKFIKKDD